MKIAVSGKGGVGKTTVSAMLAAALSLKGRGVIAIDADPDANLASALGLPANEQPEALSEMKDLIAERTGSKDAYGGYFKLNPRVDDIPEKYARVIGNIRLLILGGVKEGGAGCICPATALVKALLTHLIIGRDDAIVMDMEAGIEHLGRATAQSMDAMIIVVDYRPWSIQTAHRIHKLAGSIGMRRLFALANCVRRSADVNRIRRELGQIPLIGQIPYDERIAAGVVRLTKAGDVEPTEVFRDYLGNVEIVLLKLNEALKS